MESSLPISFNSRVPRELKMFIEIIKGVAAKIENPKWKNNQNREIGFYIVNKQKLTEYFFGIWYDLWENSGVPLSIVLGYDGKAPIEWNNRIKKVLTDNQIDGITVKEFNEYVCILFNYDFFKFDKGDDIATLSKLFTQLTKYGDSIA